jgi:hypothetical protein
VKKVEELTKIIEDKKKLKEEKERETRTIEIIEEKIKLTEDVSQYCSTFVLILNFGLFFQLFLIARSLEKDANTAQKIHQNQSQAFRLLLAQTARSQSGKARRGDF